MANRTSTRSALVMLILATAGVVAIRALTPLNGGLVGGVPIAVDTSPGDQNDPHINGHVIAYTDNSGLSSYVRYFDLVTNAGAVIPAAPADRDLLPDVSGNRISFSRVMSDRVAAMVYDLSASTLTEVAPAPGSHRLGTSIGGDTVAYVDALVGNGEVFVYNLAAGGPPVNLSASLDFDANPDVAPDGNAVVWTAETAGGPQVMKAIRTGGVWGASQFVSSPAWNGATDGTSIVYDSERLASVGGSDIYLQPLFGGPETQLEIAGTQFNPTIDSGVVAFSHTDPTPGAKADILIYVIATNTLFRVTDTPLVGEHLNDISVLPNGDVQVVWAVEENESPNSVRDIVVRTFAVPLGGPVYNFTGFMSPIENPPALNVVTAGSAVPIKFSLNGNFGLGILAAGSPASSPVVCSATEPGTVIQETATAGNSTLSYDAGSDEYKYVWKTDRSWKGTCRILVVTLNDGTEQLARFRFR